MNAKLLSTYTSLVLIAGVAGGCSRSEGPSSSVSVAPPPSVQTAVVVRGSLVQPLPVVGSLDPLPNEEATVTPQVSGTLLALLVKYGDTVTLGKVIAQISSTTASGAVVQALANQQANEALLAQSEANALEQTAQTRATILQAESAVRGALAELDGAEATLDGENAALVSAEQTQSRDQTLFDEGLVSQKDLESAKLASLTAQFTVESQKKQIESQQQTVDAEQEQLDAAKTGTLLNLVKEKDVLVARQQLASSAAALAIARAQASLCTLRAPLAGKVTQIGAATGETVDSTTKLITIANLSQLLLTLPIPSNWAAEIHPGQRVTFTSDLYPGRIYTAAVFSVSDQIDPATGTVAALALVNNGDLSLKDNTVVSATVTGLKRVNVIEVPSSALLSDPNSGEKSVGIVDANSILHIVPVSVGVAANGVAEITSGVTAGEHVAVSGQYGLTDGTKVTVTGTSSPTGANGP